MSELDPEPDSSRNPAQQEVIEVLGARPHERPEFDPRLRVWIREELEERLTPLLQAIPDGEVLRLNKHALTQVHGCEGLYVANEELEFAWSTKNAVGTVAHKAIELTVHWRGDPIPGDLVDEALALLIQGTDGLADFLGGLTEAQRAELRSSAVERVTMFVECFPRLEARWRPVTESRMRVDLCNERIVLSGKVDLTVGQPQGVRAGKVLLDLKTGAFSPAHREELRFYALLETVRLGVPPRLLATYYLDGGRPMQEQVSEDVLHSALERTVAGAEAIVELRTKAREAVLRAGPACRWCPVRATCPVGQAWLQEQQEAEGW